MSKPYVTLLGKAVRRLAQLRGGGSAFPGLFIEKIDPDFIRRTLAELPHGVVIISGTNGKTTTTKMVVELLEGQGLKVFTNRTGSNFTRGVAAALLGDVDTRGHLAADIAVLELDEAHALHFIKTIPPRHSLLLNVMRDQLDRFGEIDATARMLAKIAQATTETVVLNREDPRIASIAPMIKSRNIVYFGLSTETAHHFPSDDEMRSAFTPKKQMPTADVVLSTLKGNTAQFMIGGKLATVSLQLQGIYNIYNAAAALALTRSILGDSLDTKALIASLAQVRPAFGRGETIMVDDQPVELVLVKNPSGFRLSLASFDPDGYQTMIAINDNYADGRDMSWLWDVDFETLRASGVELVTGIRTYDIALRLQYDEVIIKKVDPDLGAALRQLLTNHDQPKRIFCTYTAMLALRRELAKITDVEHIS
jgi:UDP-N-acetylmuramyl tripeptide synthase